MDEAEGQRSAAHRAADAAVMRCLLQPFGADPDWYRRCWYGDRNGAPARQAARSRKPGRARDNGWRLAPAAARVAASLVLSGSLLAATASYLLR